MAGRLQLFDLYRPPAVAAARTRIVVPWRSPGQYPAVLCRDPLCHRRRISVLLGVRGAIGCLVAKGEAEPGQGACRTDSHRHRGLNATRQDAVAMAPTGMQLRPQYPSEAACRAKFWDGNLTASLPGPGATAQPVVPASWGFRAQSCVSWVMASGNGHHRRTGRDRPDDLGAGIAGRDDRLPELRGALWRAGDQE